MIEMILVSTIAGVAGTGLGGVIGVLFGRVSNRITGLLLSFAGGVMVSVVCFDLIPEAIDMAGLPIAMVGVILGVLAVMYLDHFSEFITTHCAKNSTSRRYANKLCCVANNTISTSVKFRASMLSTGIIMLFAIGLHNLPEGMAIGSAMAHNHKLGLGMAALIAMHDVPEGMAITLPLVAGGMGRLKAIICTALSGATTIVGALIGHLLGSISDGYMALCIALAGGAMLFVTYSEILPKSFDMDEGKLTSVFSLIGIILGLLIRYALM